MKSLRENLPATFRITGYRGCVLNLQFLLLWFYTSEPCNNFAISVKKWTLRVILGSLSCNNVFFIRNIHKNRLWYFNFYLFIDCLNFLIFTYLKFMSLVEWCSKLIFLNKTCFLFLIFQHHKNSAQIAVNCFSFLYQK